MGRKNDNNKSNAATELQVSATLCSEFMWMAHAAYAQGAARLSRIAHDEKHMAELLDALDYQIDRRRLPPNVRGTGLLKRFGRGSLPDVE